MRLNTIDPSDRIEIQANSHVRRSIQQAIRALLLPLISLWCNSILSRCQQVSLLYKYKLPLFFLFAHHLLQWRRESNAHRKHYLDFLPFLFGLFAFQAVLTSLTSLRVVTINGTRSGAKRGV